MERHRTARPAARNYHHEQQLCLAVKQHRQVRIRYEHDLHYRVFQPYVVYRTPEGRVLVGGIRVRDESAWYKPAGPRKFEVGLISDLQVTDVVFAPDRFNADKPEFRHDPLCTLID